MTAPAKPRVLIVDDDEIMRRMTAEAVSALDWSVAGWAADGEEAIEKYRTLVPDIVLLDVFMPRMNGLEALMAIRDDDPDAYVVMLTVTGDADTVEDCMIAGAKDYLTKDMPVRDMVERLERHGRRLGR